MLASMSFSVDQLVADCLEASEREGTHVGVAIDEVLSRVVSNPMAIETALGHPRGMPVFSTWHHTASLTILHVVWPPDVDLMPHDHNGLWAAIGLYGGQEVNRIFRSLPGGGVELRRTKTMRARDTVVLGGDTIHAVANPTREWTGAIHVYGGDYFADGKQMWGNTAAEPEPFVLEKLQAVLNDASVAARAREDDNH